MTPIRPCECPPPEALLTVSATIAPHPMKVRMNVPTISAVRRLTMACPPLVGVLSGFDYGRFFAVCAVKCANLRRFNVAPRGEKIFVRGNLWESAFSLGAILKK